MLRLAVAAAGLTVCAAASPDTATGPLNCFEKLPGHTIRGYAMSRPRQRQAISSLRRTSGDKPPTTLEACATICFHLREEKCAAFVWREKGDRRCMLQHNKGNTAYRTGEMHDAATAAEGEDAYFWPKVFFYDVCDSSQNG